MGYSVSRITAPTFYALGDSRTPVVVSVISVLTNAGLNIVLSRAFGFTGLALGTSLAALLSATLLVWLLQRKLGGIEGTRIVSSFVRVTVAALLMGAAAGVLYPWLAAQLPGSGLVPQILRLTIVMGAALLVLAGSAWALRIPEFGQATAMVARRFGAGRR